MTFYPVRLSQTLGDWSASSDCQIVRAARFGKSLFKLCVAPGLLTVLSACTASNTLERPATTLAQTPQTQTLDKQSEDKQGAEPTLTLKTVMTSEGVECPAVRGADGTLYTVPSMPYSFEGVIS